MPKLQISLPDSGLITHELTEDTITIGRISDNMIQIDDCSVSSHHAELVRSGDGYILRDLGSTNGTRVNGVAHSEGPLGDGDMVTFGNIEATYTVENPAAAQPMPAEEAVALRAAETSVRPANFANASPFETKKKKKDPAGTAIIALAIVAMLAFAVAVASIFSLKSPL
jgi:pSer/pThr/pTyr-binding forkhead associated (FHA) protein